MNNQSDSYMLFAANPTHNFFHYYIYPTQEEVEAAIIALQSYYDALYFPKDKTIIDHVDNHTYLICMEA